MLSCGAEPGALLLVFVLFQLSWWLQLRAGHRCVRIACVHVFPVGRLLSCHAFVALSWLQLRQRSA